MLKNKLISLILAGVLVLSSSAVAFADVATTENASIRNTTSQNAADSSSTVLQMSAGDKAVLQKYLSDNNINVKASTSGVSTQMVGAIAATYFIPGVGEVALLVTGGIVVAGVAWYAGSALYEMVMPYIIGADIPGRLMKDGKTVDVGAFDQKVSGQQSVQYKNAKTGWTIEKDDTKHKGDWKLKDKQGKRKATLDKNGKILGK